MAPQVIKARVFAPLLVAVALLAPVVPAGAAGPAPGPATVGQLKQAYLACEHEATTRRLTPPEAATCSRLADQLLRYGFDGDLERLLAWWRASRTGVAAPDSRPPQVRSRLSPNHGDPS